MKLPDNWKTTLAGILGAAGLGGFASQVSTREGQISLALAALGVLLKGLFAQDAKKPAPFVSATTSTSGGETP